MTAAALCALAGCTMIGHQPAHRDWPPLDEKVVYGNLLDTHLECGGSALSFAFAVRHGCARIQLNDMCNAGTCTIFLSSRDEYGQLALEHERAHCAGQDHIGSNLLRDHFLQCRVRAGIPESPSTPASGSSSTGAGRP